MHGEYKIPGGKLAVIDMELHDGRLARVQLSGDFFLEPAQTLDAINTALEGQRADAGMAHYSTRVQAVLDQAQSYGLTADGVAHCVQRALENGA